MSKIIDKKRDYIKIEKKKVTILENFKNNYLP